MGFFPHLKCATGDMKYVNVTRVNAQLIAVLSFAFLPLTFFFFSPEAHVLGIENAFCLFYTGSNLSVFLM